MLETTNDLMGMHGLRSNFRQTASGEFITAQSSGSGGTTPSAAGCLGGRSGNGL